jgi:hypothetical protein
MDTDKTTCLWYESFGFPPGFGLRQPSGALDDADICNSGGGPPQSKTAIASYSPGLRGESFLFILVLTVFNQRQLNL